MLQCSQPSQVPLALSKMDFRSNEAGRTAPSNFIRRLQAGAGLAAVQLPFR
jgi:hypothetical protein